MEYQLNSDGSAPIQLTGSAIQLPVDIQSRLATTIQTHNAVSVAATTGTSDSSMIDCNGYSDIAITLYNDASTNSNFTIFWSHDGTTLHGADYDLNGGTRQAKSSLVPIKARYAKVRLSNTDAAPHTMSAWAFLKS